MGEKKNFLQHPGEKGKEGVLSPHAEEGNTSNLKRGEKDFMGKKIRDKSIYF